MSSTSGVLNRDLYEVKKNYPDDRVKPTYVSLPIRVMDLFDPAFTNRITTKVNTQEKLVAVTDETGSNITHWEIDNTYPLSSIVFLTPGGVPTMGDCNTRHSTYADRKYIHTAYDWKDVEGTIFFNVASFKDSDARISFKTRTGFHPRNQTCCQGASYGANLYLSDAKVEFYKESYHHSISNIDLKSQIVTSSFVNKWIGAKFNVYNRLRNGKLQVNLELHLCPSDNINDITTNWRKVNNRIDFTGGGWGKGGKRCGSLNNDDPITWGGPRSMFLFHGIDKIKLKYLSWREINPNIHFVSGGAAPRHLPLVTSVPPGYHFDKSTGQVKINDDEVV